jgi:hypothetical protein
MLGPQRDALARHDGMARHHAPGHPPREFGQRQRCFLQGELRPDAHARPKAERKILIAMQRLARARQETLGLEQVGFAPERAMPMQHIG